MKYICHLFLLAVSISTHICYFRRFLVSKMIEPGGNYADIALIQVDGEIDIRYFTVRVVQLKMSS